MVQADRALPPRSEHDLPFKTGTFSPSPRQKRLQSAIRVVRLAENLCFSTFFSTVVENFGG